MSPDGSGKPPPEEKLLKLIRGKGPRPSTDILAPSHTAGGATTGVLRATELNARAPGLRWPGLAVGFLGAVLLIEVASLVSQAMRPIPPVHLPVVATPRQPDEPVTATRPLQDIPSLAASVSRPLFTSPAADTSARPLPLPSDSAKVLASRLTLMGIVAGDPAQAIIEDSQTKRTFFVTIGQAVIEGAILEQVLDNRVVLDLAGEKIELTL